MVSNTCFNGLSEAERIKQKIKSLQNEKDCLQLAKDIYKYIERYPERIRKAGIKQVTITPASCFEANEEWTARRSSSSDGRRLR